MAMAAEVGAVAGLAIGAGGLADGVADQEAGGGAVAGLTGEVGRLGLHPGHIGGGSGGMTVCAQGHRWHVVRMTMAIEVGAMTGVAVRVVRFADGAANQEAGGGAVAGLATDIAQA